MGLAASQARLLQLTSRQHTIEYQAQKIQAQKLQLANESDASYNKYMQALDSVKIQYKYVESDGSVSYKNATFNALFTGQDGGCETQYALEIINGDNYGKFYLKDASINGNKLISTFETYQQKYKTALSNIGTSSQVPSDDTLKTFFNDEINDNNRKDYLQQYFAYQFSVVGLGNVNGFDPSTGDATAYENNIKSDNSQKASYYYRLFLGISEGAGVVEMDDDYEDDVDWLTNMIANSQVMLHKYDVTGGDDAMGGWIETTVSNDTMLAEIEDEKEVKKAEATYEAETAYINRKDTKYDTLLSQTESERTAIKTEMDSLKKIASENVDRTFKLFS